MPNTRIKYIDVAKGLLILMVVLPHMSQVADLYYIHNNGFELIRIFSRSWVGYYMPAFFLITGMCSNFTQTFKAFLLKNLKTLMLPSFTLMALCVWIENILNGSLDIRDYLSVGFSSFLKCGGLYWFITALFIAKILYWVVINRVSSRFYRYVTMGIVMLFGCLCNNLLDFEPWYLWHALILSPFMQIGNDIGAYWINSPILQWKLQWRIGLPLVYVILMILLYAVDLKLPAVTQKIVLSLYEIPLLLLLALSGTYVIIQISQWIDSCKWIEFLGRHTLVVYCLHVYFARRLFMHYQVILSTNTYISIIVTFGLIAIIILLCSLISYILNTKYLKFFIGKF